MDMYSNDINEESQEIEENRRRIAAIEEAKWWPEMMVPLTLADGLGMLNKDELSYVRSSVGVKGVSKLNKKDLLNVLIEKVPELLPELFNKFDEKRYRILKQLADRNGHAARLDLNSFERNYFRERGLIFTGTHEGQHVFVMPLEVLEAFRAIDDAAYRLTIQRNTEWISLTLGLLFYYGTLTLIELKALMERHTGELPTDVYLSLLEDAGPFYGAPSYSQYGLSARRVINAGRIKQEHEMRPAVNFYPFSKSQLLRAGEPGFVDKSPSFRAFVNYLVETYPISREEADQYVEECVYAINIGESPSDIIQWLANLFEMDSMEHLNAMMEQVISLYNQTRQWFLKGYSPNDLQPSTPPVREGKSAAKASVIDFGSRKKVGRNDPCPCGSGKKYKKCCGR